jgi:hypothetical protein
MENKGYHAREEEKMYEIRKIVKDAVAILTEQSAKNTLIDTQILRDIIKTVESYSIHNATPILSEGIQDTITYNELLSLIQKTNPTVANTLEQVVEGSKEAPSKPKRFEDELATKRAQKEREKQLTPIHEEDDTIVENRAA